MIGRAFGGLAVGVLAASAFIRARTGVIGPVPRVVVIVVDGLRPDLITPATMPALAALRARGVTYTNTHSSIPTVTRVNSSVLTTGNFPANTGIVGNTLFDRDADSVNTISTSDDRALDRIVATRGRLIAATTLGERIQNAKLKYVVAGTGSAGASYLANAMGPSGVGITINANLRDATRASWTDSVNERVFTRFGRAPSDSEMRATTKHFGPLMRWLDRVVREYVLPDLRPDVMMYWVTEPDDSQHSRGPGSPQAMESMRESDAVIGHLVAALDSASGGVDTATNFFVVSDHGFATHAEGVPVVSSLVAAGLKQSARSNDVVVVNESQSLHLYIKDHDPAKARALVSFFQSKPWTAAVFARDEAIPGVFPLRRLFLDSPRGPDLFIPLVWRADTNAFGVHGLQTIAVNGAGGPITTGAAGHGGMSPYTIHSTMILAGPAFRRGVSVTVPSGSVDVTPTILRLLGLSTSGTDGRVLEEALRSGTVDASIAAKTDTIIAESGAFRSMLQITTLGKAQYVDAVWRSPPR